jgi:hypothetical protein
MELDLQSLFGLHVYGSTHWLRPRIWAHKRGRYLSAKVDDISLSPPEINAREIGKLREHKKTFVEPMPQDVTSFLHLLDAPKIFYIVSDIFPQLKYGIQVSLLILYANFAYHIAKQINYNPYSIPISSPIALRLYCSIAPPGKDLSLGSNFEIRSTSVADGATALSLPSPPLALRLLLLLLLSLPVVSATAVIAEATVLDVTGEQRTGLAMKDLYFYIFHSSEVSKMGKVE